MLAGTAKHGPTEIYLDNNATTSPLPEVIEAMADVMRHASGNPSSVHARGARARAVLNQARSEVAAAVRAHPDHVVFTSGATEANNLAMQGLFNAGGVVRRLVTTPVEHSSVLALAEHLRTQGVDVVLLPVDGDGRIDPDSLREAILPVQTLVSIQWANNETGVIQDIATLAHTAQELGAVFHTDAVQAVGKVEVDLESTPVDLLSLSGHKVHGPLGVGALVGPGIDRVRPMTRGGSQEQGIRPGTENVPAIAGLATALKLRGQRFGGVAGLTRALRDHLESELIHRGLVASVNGGGAARLPNTSNLRFAGIDGEALTIRLDQVGVRCSQSSACTNQRPEPSYVLRAMGLTEDEAYASVRFGVSELTTREEMDTAIERIGQIHASLSRYAVA